MTAAHPEIRTARPQRGPACTVPFLILLFLVLPPLAPAPFSALAAQERPGQEAAGRELQVPVDEAFLEITPQVRRQLGLFPEVEDFQSARLFLLEGGGYVLEVSALRDGRIERSRTFMTEYDLGLFREDLETRLDQSGSSLVLNREGRGGLVLRETVLGVAFYGWAVPTIFGMSDDRAQVATYLLTAGASFYVPYRLTRNLTVTEAHRSYVLWGGTRGIVHGALIGGMLKGPRTERFDGFEDDELDRAVLASAMGGSILGSYLAFKAVDRGAPDEGTVRLWGALGDIGILWGLGTAHVLGFYDEELVTSDPGDPFTGQGTRTPRLRLGHGVTLAGAAGGLYLGRKLGERERYTVGNVTALKLMGALGVQSALPLMRAVDVDEDKIATAGALAGGTAGLLVGNRLLRGQTFTEGDGLILLAGHLAGGLSAAGVTYLIEGGGGGSNSDLLYLTTTALGSWAGFALTYRALDHRRDEAWRESGGEARSERRGTGPAGRVGHRSGLRAGAGSGGDGFLASAGRRSNSGVFPGRDAAVRLQPSALLAPLLSGLSGNPGKASAGEGGSREGAMIGGGTDTRGRGLVRLPLLSVRF